MISGGLKPAHIDDVCGLTEETFCWCWQPGGDIRDCAAVVQPDALAAVTDRDFSARRVASLLVGEVGSSGCWQG